MKIVFLGTPDFAVPALDALWRAGHEILAVVTQPDKPKGRSGKLTPPPVKEWAAAHEVAVLQPERIRRPEAVARLASLGADVFVAAAFGQILSQEILDLPRYGCLCIHASLLPRYRGASPIQHVILNGEEKSGVTIMQMDAGIDTGDMLYKKEVPILREDTYQTLHDKLKEAGAQAITEALPLLEQGRLVPVKQTGESCYAPLIKKEMGRMDFSADALSLERLVRGLNPWPSAYTYYRGKQLKIWEAQALEGRDEKAAPGTVIRVEPDAVLVAAGEGLLCIRALQLEGKKRMSAHDFLLGVRMTPGERLGGKE